MKRLFLIFFLAFLAKSVHSQVIISLLLGDKLNNGKVEFGLDGGLNLVSIKGADDRPGNRFNIGFYFDIKTKNPHWLYHTGVIVKSTMGAEGLPVYSLHNAELDSAFVNGRVERTINYFHVPFMMKYKYNSAFYAEGGIMLALRSKAHDVFVQTVNHSDDLTYEVSTSDRFHRIDAGVIAGIGYRLMGGNGMNLGIRYFQGLMNMNIDSSLPKEYNQSVYFVVGIPIGAGKAKKAREEKQGME